MTDGVQDVNALLGRYQNEIAKVTTRAIVAEAMHAETRTQLQSTQAEVASLREHVNHLQSQLDDCPCQDDDEPVVAEP